MSNLKQQNLEKNPMAANLTSFQLSPNQINIKNESSKDQIEYVHPLIPKRLTTTLAYKDKVFAR